MPLSSSYLLQVPFLLQLPGFSSSSPAAVITNTKPVALGSRHILFSLLEILKSSLELPAAASRPACIYLLGSVRRVHTVGCLPSQEIHTFWLVASRQRIASQPPRGTGVSITLTGKRPKELFCEICVRQAQVSSFPLFFEYSSQVKRRRKY